MGRKEGVKIRRIHDEHCVDRAVRVADNNRVGREEEREKMRKTRKTRKTKMKMKMKRESEKGRKDERTKMRKKMTPWTPEVPGTSTLPRVTSNILTTHAYLVVLSYSLLGTGTLKGRYPP